MDPQPEEVKSSQEREKTRTSKNLTYFGENVESAKAFKSIIDEAGVDDTLTKHVFKDQKSAKRFLEEVIECKRAMGNGHTSIPLKKLEHLLNESVTLNPGDDNEGSRVFSARRPPSHTHQILKTAGLTYERGQPVFANTTGPAIHNRSRLRERPPIDRRGAASALDFLKRAESDLDEKKMQLSKPWWDSSSLNALDLDHHHKEGWVKGDLVVSLPRICKAPNSLTKAVATSQRLGVKSVTNKSIIVDTTNGQQIVATSIVKLNAEAQDIKYRLERTLSEKFCIDLTRHNIPIRLTGEAEMLRIAFEQKSRKNAQILCPPIRTISVKREVKLQKFQGRLLHSTMEKKLENERSKDKYHLDFHYKRKPGISADDFPASCARVRSTVHRSVEEILVLEGMHREHVTAEIARELGRSYLFLEDFPSLDIWTESGFAELCCYLLITVERKTLEQRQIDAEEQMKELERKKDIVRDELQDINLDIEKAKKERMEADEAELLAKKKFADAKEAKFFGWPGAQRKMEAARLAALDAERELKEAVDAEASVMGERLPVAQAESNRISATFKALQQEIEKNEKLICAYNVYLLAMENNPHPVLGSGFRHALLSYDSVAGNMPEFLSHLKATGKFAEPRRKTAEEMKAEEEELLREERAKQEAEAEERNKQSQEKIKALKKRLQEAPRGAPGAPPALLYSEPVLRKAGSEASSAEDVIVDDLQDLFNRSEPGTMGPSALSEYFSQKIRGEHNSQYCYELGESHLESAKSLRATGDLDGALVACDKAQSLFTHAGPEGEKKLWTVTSLQNSIQREQSQLQTALSFQKKAEAALQSGVLFEGFRKFYTEAMHLYKNCGIAANRDDRRPALERLHTLAHQQEESFQTLNRALETARAKYEKGELDVALCQQMGLAISMLSKIGAVGQQNAAIALQLQHEIRAALHQTCTNAELRARRALDTTRQDMQIQKPAMFPVVDSENLKIAEEAVLQVWHACRLSAIANCDVDATSGEENLIKAQEKQAKIQSSTVNLLSTEIAGSWHQFHGMELLQEHELYSWPENEGLLIQFCERASEALRHLSAARTCYIEAGNQESRNKILRFQPIELDLALRTGAQERCKELIEKMENSVKGGSDARMPFVCVAAAFNNAEGLQLLLARGADINARDHYGNTPLHLAVIFQAHVTLKKICAVKTLDPNLKNNAGRTPLMDAVVRLLPEKVSSKFLLWHLLGAKARMIFKSTGAEQKEEDVVRNSITVVETLLDLTAKIDPNAVNDYNGKTALMMAAEVGNREALLLLLKNPKILANSWDLRGKTALILAVCKKQPIDMLLQSEKVDPNFANPQSGMTPLHYAIKTDNLNALSLLVAHDFVQLNLRDRSGSSPLHLIEFHNKISAGIILLGSKHIRDADMQSSRDSVAMPACKWWIERVESSDTGMWSFASPDAFHRMVVALAATSQWIVLHDFLCNFWVIETAIASLGVEDVCRTLSFVTQQANLHPGVSQIVRSDFQELENVLRHQASAFWSSNSGYLNVAIHLKLSVLRRMRGFIEDLVQISAQRGDSALGDCNDAPRIIQRLEWLRRVKDYGFDSILRKPCTFFKALKEESRRIKTFRVQNSIESCVDSAHNKEISGKKNSNLAVAEQLASILQNELRLQDSDCVQIVVDVEWDSTQVNNVSKQITSVLDNFASENGNGHVCFRVVRWYSHKNQAYIHMSKLACSSSNQKATLNEANIVDLAIRTFADTSSAFSTVMRDLKVVAFSRSSPSIFLTFQLMIPYHTREHISTRENFEALLLLDLRNVGISDDVRVDRLSETWSYVIVEVLAKSGKHASIKLIKMLVSHINQKGPNPWKGVVTCHAVCCSLHRATIPPLFPGEWRTAKITILAASKDLHNELYHLEKYIMPAIKFFCVGKHCHLEWRTLSHGTDKRIIFHHLRDLNNGFVTNTSPQPIQIGIVLIGGSLNSFTFSNEESATLKDLTTWVSENELESHDQLGTSRLVNAYLQHSRTHCSILIRKRFIGFHESLSSLPDVIRKFLPKQDEGALNLDVLNCLKKCVGNRCIEYDAGPCCFLWNKASMQGRIEYLRAQIRQVEQSIAKEEHGWKKYGTAHNNFLIQARTVHLQGKILLIKQEIWCLIQVRNLLLGDIVPASGESSEDPFFEELTQLSIAEGFAADSDSKFSAVILCGLNYNVNWQMFQVATVISNELNVSISPCKPISVCLGHERSRYYQNFLLNEYSNKFLCVDGEPRSLLINEVAQAVGVPCETEQRQPLLMLQGTYYCGKTTFLSKIITRVQRREQPASERPVLTIFFFRANESFADLLLYLRREVIYQVRGGFGLVGIDVSDPHGDEHVGLNALKRELLYALTEKHNLLIVVDNLDEPDQIALSKVVLECSQQFLNHDQAGTLQLLLTTENSKQFKSEARAANLFGESKSVLRVFLMKGLTKSEQAQLWSHFLKLCDTAHLHENDIDILHRNPKQDSDSPLYLLFLALLPKLSQSPASQTITEQIEHLSGKVGQLWKHDILPRVAFSSGFRTEMVEQSINTLSSLSGGIRTDLFCSMISNTTGSILSCWDSDARFDVFCENLSTIFRPRKHANHPIAVEHVHLHHSGAHESDSKHILSTVGSSRVNYQASFPWLMLQSRMEEPNTQESIYHDISLKQKIKYMRSHHQDIFVRAVILPLAQAASGRINFDMSALNPAAADYCRKRHLFAIENETADTATQVLNWSVQLDAFCANAKLEDQWTDPDAQFATVFNHLKQCESIHEDMNSAAVRGTLESICLCLDSAAELEDVTNSATSISEGNIAAHVAWNKWKQSKHNFEVIRESYVTAHTAIQDRLVSTMAEFWATSSPLTDKLEILLRLKISYYVASYCSELEARARCSRGLALGKEDHSWMHLTPRMVREEYEKQDQSLSALIPYLLDLARAEECVRLKASICEANDHLRGDSIYAAKRAIDTAYSTISEIKQGEDFKSYPSGVESTDLRLLAERIKKMESTACLSGEKSFVFGPSLVGGVCDRPSVFWIAAKNRQGTKRKKGGDLTRFLVSIKDPQQTIVPFSAREAGNGTYIITFFATVPGRYSIAVQCHEGLSDILMDVRGSPWIAKFTEVQTAWKESILEHLPRHFGELDIVGNGNQILGVNSTDSGIILHFLTKDSEQSNEWQYNQLDASEMFGPSQVNSVRQGNDDKFLVFIGKTLEFKDLKIWLLNSRTQQSQNTEVVWKIHSAMLFHEKCNVQSTANEENISAPHGASMIDFRNVWFTSFRNDSSLMHDVLAMVCISEDGTWKHSRNSCQVGRQLFVFGHFSNRDFVLVGSLKKDQSNNNLVDALDSAPDDEFVWSSLASQGDTPCPRSNFMVSVESDMIFVGGGTDVDGTELNDLFALNVKDMTWKRILNLTTLKKNLAASLSRPGIAICSGVLVHVHDSVVRELTFSPLLIQQELSVQTLKGLLTRAKVFYNDTKNCLRLKTLYGMKRSIFKALNRSQVDFELEQASEICDILQSSGLMEIKDLKMELFALRNSMRELNSLAMEGKAKILSSMPTGQNVVISCALARLTIAEKEVGSYGLFETGFSNAAAEMDRELAMLSALEADLQMEDRMEKFFGDSEALSKVNILLGSAKKRLYLFQTVWTEIEKFHGGCAGRLIHHIVIDNIPQIETIENNIVACLAQDSIVNECDLAKSVLSLLSDAKQAIRLFHELQISQTRDTRFFFRSFRKLTGKSWAPPTLQRLLQDRIMENENVKKFIADLRKSVSVEQTIQSWHITQSSPGPNIPEVGDRAIKSESLSAWSNLRARVFPLKFKINKRHQNIRSLKPVFALLLSLHDEQYNCLLGQCDEIKLHRFSSACLLSGTCASYSVYFQCTIPKSASDSKKLQGLLGAKDIVFLVHEAKGPFWLCFQSLDLSIKIAGHGEQENELFINLDPLVDGHPSMISPDEVRCSMDELCVEIGIWGGNLTGWFNISDKISEFAEQHDVKNCADLQEEIGGTWQPNDCWILDAGGRFVIRDGIKRAALASLQ